MAERINLHSFRKEVDSTYVGFTPNGGSIKPVHVANGVQRWTIVNKLDTKRRKEKRLK